MNDWGKKVYVVTNYDGEAEAVSSREAEAMDYAVAQGGGAFLIHADERGGPEIGNAVEDAGWKAYEQTGLRDVCLAKYGSPHLTADLVDSIDLMEAWSRVRPYLPPGKKFEPSWKNLPMSVPKSETGSYFLLAANAKLAKDKTFDGTEARCFGLSLAPHRAGLRPMGTPTADGFQYFAAPKRPSDFFVDTEEGKDYLFAVASKDSDNPLAKSGGSREDGKFGVEYYSKARTLEKRPTVCPRATGGDFGCIASCLAHSGQNPASDEALRSKLALTAALYADPAAFCKLLLETLRRYFSNGPKDDKRSLFVRLNVFSDVPWEQLFPDLLDPHMALALREFDTSSRRFASWRDRRVIGRGSFYDYTKVPRRMEGYVDRHLLRRYPDATRDDLLVEANAFYWLTFSYSGTGDNQREAIEHLNKGGTVAVVFVREQGAWEDGGFVSDGPALVGIDVKPFAFRYGLDANTAGQVKALWEYARSDSQSRSSGSSFAKAVRALGEDPPQGRPRQERFEIARRLISRLIGVNIPAKDLVLPPSQGKENLRFVFGGKFWYSFTFLGRPILNADANDLRGLDHALIADPTVGRQATIDRLRRDGVISAGAVVPPGTIVGLDFKPPYVKTKLDLYEVVHRVQLTNKKGELVSEERSIDSYLSEEDAHDLSAEHPGSRVKRMGKLSGSALDLSKSKFVTGVRETADGLLVAAQTPRSTSGGDL
jgi:hypothetical protein